MACALLQRRRAAGGENALDGEESRGVQKALGLEHGHVHSQARLVQRTDDCRAPAFCAMQALMYCCASSLWGDTSVPALSFAKLGSPDFGCGAARAPRR